MHSEVVWFCEDRLANSKRAEKSCLMMKILYEFFYTNCTEKHLAAHT